MSRSYRIAVADDDPAVLILLREYLLAAGHEVVVEASSGEELVQRTNSSDAEVVITDIKMSGVDGLSAAAVILEHRKLPVIVVSAYFDEELVERANTCGVFGYLVKPVRPEDLTVTIAVAVQRFEEFQLLRRETSNLRQTLTDRKTIERAKGILMKNRGIDESSAFHHLQQIARTKRTKMIDVANSILLAAEALDSSFKHSLDRPRNE